jgi:hypothetical protein
MAGFNISLALPMSISMNVAAIGAKDIVEESQALLRYAAHRLATQNSPAGPVSDLVCLSDTALAVIEGKIAAATGR